MKLQFPRWIGVVCDDLERQRAFYRDVLGMREVNEGDGWIHYDLGQNLTFELLQRTTDPEYDHSRYQVGFAVEDIAAARTELIANGAEPLTDVMVSSDGLAKWAYFRDPEGNVFEISQRP